METILKFFTPIRLNFLKILVAKISSKKYNGAVLYKVYKKDGICIDNCYNFIYPACPEPTKLRDIRQPAFKIAGEGWERR